MLSRYIADPLPSSARPLPLTHFGLPFIDCCSCRVSFLLFCGCPHKSNKIEDFLLKG